MNVKLFAFELTLLLGCLSNAAGQTKHILKGTYFETNGLSQVTQCSTFGCRALSPMVPTTSIVCPALANQTCTYNIFAQGSLHVTFGDSQFFRFLIDRAAPNPGPTFSDGTVIFEQIPPAFESAAVTGIVTNGVDNQAHVIRVDFGCEDNVTSPNVGCVANIQLPSVRIDVFRP